MGKEAARGNRHAQKGCPSEGHCREHRLEETHVAQQHQSPSKGHFNPLGHQGLGGPYRDAAALCHQQTH